MGMDARVDRLIIGAGIFGLYAALILRRKGHSVTVVDLDRGPLLRASLVNQARIHMGYHYPRSVFTALQSVRRSERFLKDFPKAVVSEFRQIYAVSATGSLTDARGFERFCRSVDIPLVPIDPAEYFDPRAIEAAYETREFCFDAGALRRQLTANLKAMGGIDWRLGTTISSSERTSDGYHVTLRDGSRLDTGGVVNATYAGTNQILAMFGFAPLPLKYELCEVALVDPTPLLGNVGVTVMDGPFFSLTPFGRSGIHALTAVDVTPRLTSTDLLPTFPCQQHNAVCQPGALDNCSPCPARPTPSFSSMRQLVRRFFRSDLELRHRESLFAVKTVLQTTEVDDARPTIVIRFSEEPLFATVFSGKVTTLYDLEDLL